MPLPFDSSEGAALRLRLRREMEERYPEEGAGKLSDPREFTPPRGLFLMVLDGATAVACGALREWRPGIAEIKRMYVAPGARGRGLSRRLLAALEAAAAGLGYRKIRLETGTAQPEALGLYASSGYARITPYGEFKESPTSICFEKALA